MEGVFDTPQTVWTISHPFGKLQPHVDAYASDGAWLLVQPVHSTGQVQVTFGKPTTGRLVLSTAAGELVDTTSQPVIATISEPILTPLIGGHVT